MGDQQFTAGVGKPRLHPCLIQSLLRVPETDFPSDSTDHRAREHNPLNGYYVNRFRPPGNEQSSFHARVVAVCLAGAISMFTLAGTTVSGGIRCCQKSIDRCPSDQYQDPFFSTAATRTVAVLTILAILMKKRAFRVANHSR